MNNKEEGDFLLAGARPRLIVFDFGIRICLGEDCLEVEVLIGEKATQVSYVRTWVFEDTSEDTLIAEMQQFVSEASLIPIKKVGNDARETPAAPESPPADGDAPDG